MGDTQVIDVREDEELDREMREKIIETVKYVESYPSPDPITLEEDVFALRRMNG